MYMCIGQMCPQSVQCDQPNVSFCCLFVCLFHFSFLSSVQVTSCASLFKLLLISKRMYTNVTPDNVYSFKRFAMDCHSSQVCIQCRIRCIFNTCTMIWHCSIVQSTFVIYISWRRFCSSSPQWVHLCWTDCCDRMWKNLALYRSLWITMCFCLSSLQPFGQTAQTDVILI